MYAMIDELESLRKRVKHQDAEITRLKQTINAMADRIAAAHEVLAKAAERHAIQEATAKEFADLPPITGGGIAFTFSPDKPPEVRAIELIQ